MPVTKNGKHGIIIGQTQLCDQAELRTGDPMTFVQVLWEDGTQTTELSVTLIIGD